MLGLDAVLQSVSGIFQNRTVSWIMTIVGGVLFVISFFIPTKHLSRAVQDPKASEP